MTHFFGQRSSRIRVARDGRLANGRIGLCIVFIFGVEFRRHLRSTTGEKVLSGEILSRVLTQYVLMTKKINKNEMMIANE